MLAKPPAAPDFPGQKLRGMKFQVSLIILIRVGGSVLIQWAAQESASLPEREFVVSTDVGLVFLLGNDTGTAVIVDPDRDSVQTVISDVEGFSYCSHVISN
jgi:hypothetical protein